ncbi:MAG: flagellar basal body rod protein FlgB [Rhodocyclaceae bacterium]
MKALLDNAMSFHQKALNVQAYRQELLASNIANADTPHYKAKDIDFRSALKGALDERNAPLALAATSPRHIVPDAGAYGPFEGYTGFRQELQASVDGNTVNMDVERAAFAENSIHYEASVRFISSMIQGMQRAISGQ